MFEGIVTLAVDNWKESAAAAGTEVGTEKLGNNHHSRNQRQEDSPAANERIQRASRPVEKERLAVERSMA